MIDKLTYDEVESIINGLKESSENLGKIIDYYKEKLDNGTIKMERFNLELGNYINYLSSILSINKDADKALEKLKELNS